VHKKKTLGEQSVDFFFMINGNKLISLDGRTRRISI
jgi:hypothetical protein